MNYATTVGNLEIHWQLNSSVGNLGDNPNTHYGAVSKFKVVLIPASAIKANPKLNLNDYESVKKTFDLTD